MRTAILTDPLDFDGWRTAARAFRLAGVEPAQARFVVGSGQAALFENGGPSFEKDGAFTAPSTCTCSRGVGLALGTTDAVGAAELATANGSVRAWVIEKPAHKQPTSAMIATTTRCWRPTSTAATCCATAARAPRSAS